MLTAASEDFLFNKLVIQM